MTRIQEYYQQICSASKLSCHLGDLCAEAETALVEQLTITLGNVHDGNHGESALPPDPGEVYADSAYRGRRFAAAVRVRGGTARHRNTKRSIGWPNDTARSTGYEPGSRRSSGPGSAPTASGGCASEV